MLKNIVGDWGADLDDSEYACALAALGVLESTALMEHRRSSDPARLRNALEREFAFGERTPVWRGAFGPDLMTTKELWRTTEHEDAAALALAWRQYRNLYYHERYRPRLGVVLRWRERSDLFDFDGLCAWLDRVDVGIDALVLLSGREAVSGAWHWPLRVAVPLGTHEGILAALRTAQDEHQWVARLSQLYSVGGGRDSCDLLILTKAATKEILAQTRTRIRARFVVCLDNTPPLHSEIPERYGELRDRLSAAGLAVVGRPDSHNLTEWFVGLLRQVSHDVPIHAAVTTAGREKLKREPLVLGDPRALDRCRILALAKRQDRVATQLAKDREATRGTTEPEEAEPTFGGPAPVILPAPPQPVPRSLRRRYADDFRKRVFTSEEVDGEDTAKELSKRADDIEAARTPRWIQANAWRPDAPEKPAPSLAPRQWNLLAVHIGPSEQQRRDTAFPERALDFSRGNVDLTVQLEVEGAQLAEVPSRLLGAGTQPATLMQVLRIELPSPAEGEKEEESSEPGIATAEISLPPAGNSTAGMFAVRPQKDVVAGRISIIHNNRVLQRAQISVPAGDTPEEGSGVNVVAEAPAHPRFDDLEERREYDVAIQVSDIGGKLHLTIQQDGKVTPVQLDDLSKPISEIRQSLERVAITWDYDKPVLEQEKFPEELYTLAAYGSTLEQHLREKCGDKIDAWDRIHLVPATNEFLPLEYVYDGPAPAVTATVCPNMLGALEHVSCDKAVPAAGVLTACPNQKDTEFVCPMHFWGFRKLIERSGVIDDATSNGPPAQVTVPSKGPYGKVRSMLFAASNRTFKYKAKPEDQLAERAALVDALGKISGVPVDADDWKKWREGVKNKPNLLVLVVHSDKYRNVPSLEIGDGKFLGQQEIKADVCGDGVQPLLLLLIGCSVADVHENFQPYPQRFRSANANIVIAPIATIRGKDAVPIAKRIVDVLSVQLAKPESTGFGELLPLLRRELLRDGHPGVMGIVGFGDGDWLLGGF